MFAPPVKTGVEGVVADEEPWPEEPELDPEAELPWVAAAALLAAAAEVGTRLEPVDEGAVANAWLDELGAGLPYAAALEGTDP